VLGHVDPEFLAATIVGWLSIAWLLRYLRTHSFVPFAVYLLIAAPIAAAIIQFR
jgi:undecaprenyl pyrophosphate phosphatase UppP